MADDRQDISSTFIKIVYFDEESASDLLDISSGGRAALTKEEVAERVAEMHGKAEASAVAKFGWFPFFGGSAEVGGGASASNLGRNILNKTLSNTILTDYLEMVNGHPGVKQLTNITVVATEGSAAFTKMFTPYIAMLKMEESPINFAGLGDALEAAKGYYELLGTDPAGEKCILRFNSRAFRNNYGLTDLGRMRLVFHGIQVGRAGETSLTMAAEMNPNKKAKVVNVREALDQVPPTEETLLDVYDVLLAGVHYVK